MMTSSESCLTLICGDKFSLSVIDIVTTSPIANERLSHLSGACFTESRPDTSRLIDSVLSSVLFTQVKIAVNTPNSALTLLVAIF